MTTAHHSPDPPADPTPGQHHVADPAKRRPNTLRPYERLKRRKAIEALFARAQRVHHQGVTCTYAWLTPVDLNLAPAAFPKLFPGPAQVMVGAGKRHFKRAVVRNQRRRWLREAYRHRKPTASWVGHLPQPGVLALALTVGRNAPTSGPATTLAVAGVLAKLQQRLATAPPPPTQHPNADGAPAAA